MASKISPGLQVYLILDEFLMGGEIQETSKKVGLGDSMPFHDSPHYYPKSCRHVFRPAINTHEHTRQSIKKARQHF